MEGEDQESVETSQPTSPNGKRVPKKKHYPFGTPSHKVPFSQYNHLKSTDILLFHELSQSDNIPAEIRSGTEDLSALRPGMKSDLKSDVKTKRGPVKVDDDFLKYAQPTKPEDGTELCKRIDCRNLLRKILDSMSTLQVERDNIHIEIELLGNEYSAAEQENVQFEEKLKMITRENDQLEATLEHLNGQLSKLENKKIELQQERDEFGNKMMVTETEKQNWIRQVQQAHKGLADAMWRGERQAEEPKHSDIILKKRSASTPNTNFDRAQSTAYHRLASGGVVDYSERPLPPTTSSIPLYLKMELLPLTASQIDADARSLASAGSARMSLGGSKSASSGRLKPITLSDDEKLRKRIQKLNKDNSPFVQVHGDSYRGYTPSGAPSNRARSPHRISQTPLQNSNSISLSSVKKLLSRSMPALDRRKFMASQIASQELSLCSEIPNSELSNNPDHTWSKLDPVFFNARAGESYCRSNPVGKQIMIKSQSEFTRLLTFQHPGLNNTKGIGDL